MEFGIGTGVVVLVCLLATVLSQELFIPDVSTQRIYLPCSEPEIGTLEHDIVKTLMEFTALGILKRILVCDSDKL